jgi:hypothetical protein
VRPLRSLCGCAFCQQHERADQFVAPLDLVHKLELELHKIPRWFHACSLLLTSWPRSGAMRVDVRPSQWTAPGSVQGAQWPEGSRRECGACYVKRGDLL